MTPVQFLASRFPGKTEQEYRQHLGNFQISGMTGCVLSFYRGCQATHSSADGARVIVQVAADRHSEWRTKVARSIRCAIVTAAAYLAAR